MALSVFVPCWPACLQAGTIGYVYVNAEGSVVGYAVNPAGLLTPVPGSPFTTITSSSSCDVMTMIYDDMRGVLYASNPGANTISALKVDTSTGALSPVPGSPFSLTTPSGGSEHPAGLALDATRTYLYAGKGWGGFSGVDGFLIAPDGSLTLLGGSPFGVSISESGFVALNDPVENTIITGSNSTDLTVLKVVAGGALTPIPGSPFTRFGASWRSATPKPMWCWGFRFLWGERFPGRSRCQ